METLNNATVELLQQRFGHDCLIALATLDGDWPAVRTVNALYMDRAFYVVTNALSGKMQQITQNERVAVSGEWFTGRGRGENLGHIQAPQNAALAQQLRTAFAAWYDNGHVNEQDPHTCILKIRMERGTLLSHGDCYEIDFRTE